MWSYIKKTMIKGGGASAKWRPMTVAEEKSFDRAMSRMDKAFERMDEAFAEMDKAFREFDDVPKRKK